MSSLLNIQPSESLQMGKMLVSKSGGEKRQRGEKKIMELLKLNIFETAEHVQVTYIFIFFKYHTEI